MHSILKNAAGLALAAAAAASGTLSAQPAQYQDGTLTIPYTAIPGKTPAYYSDVVLEAQSDGSMLVLSGNENPLVYVDTVSANVLESLPLQVQVTVNGNKSVPCVELLPEAVSRDGNDFSVVLAESVLGPAESCIAVLEPFEVVIDLDVADLPAGDYSVDVNGVTASFQL